MKAYYVQKSTGELFKENDAAIPFQRLSDARKSASSSDKIVTWDWRNGCAVGIKSLK